MPRNSSGNYTLPAGNPVAPDTLIETAWANPTLADVAAEITNSLDRQGRGTMLAPLKLFDGTVIAPAVSFNSESSTGMYHPAPHILAFAVAGIAMALFGDTDVTLTKNVIAQQNLTVTGATSLTGALTLTGPFTPAGVINLPLGTAPLPSLTFQGDPNTGFYSPGADQIAWATAGVMRGTVSPAGNWFIATPSSGVALAVAGLAKVGTGAASPSNAQLLINSINATKTGLQIFQDGQDSWFVGMNASNTALRLQASGVDTLTIANIGNVTINAPTADPALLVIGRAGLTNVAVAQFSQAANGMALTIDSPTSASSYLAGTNIGDAVIRTEAFNLNIGTVGGDTNIATGSRQIAQFKAAGNVTINAPVAGNETLTVLGAASGAASALRVAAGRLPTGNAGIQFASGLTAGRSTSDTAGQLCAITNVFDAACMELSVGSSTIAAVAAIVLRGSGAQAPSIIQMMTAGVERVRVGTSTCLYLFPEAGSTALNLQSGFANVMVLGTASGNYVHWLPGGGPTLRWEASSSGLTFDWYVPGIGQAMFINNNGANVPGPAAAANNTLVPNTAWVQANIAAGVGQVYTNVTASRSFNTDAPTSTRPRQVCVSCGFGSAGTAAAVVGGVTVAQVQSSAGSFTQVLSFLVPPGLVYRVNTAGAPSKDLWTET